MIPFQTAIYYNTSYCPRPHSKAKIANIIFLSILLYLSVEVMLLITTLHYSNDVFYLQTKNLKKFIFNVSLVLFNINEERLEKPWKYQMDQSNLLTMMHVTMIVISFLKSCRPGLIHNHLMSLQHILSMNQF